MKKYIIADSGCLGLDTETEEVFIPESKREAISRIMVAEEPMTVVVKKFNKDYEFNVKKDDLIITFYEIDFEYPAIVVKSKDWVKNIKNYEKNLQKAKKELGDCDTQGKCLGK